MTQQHTLILGLVASGIDLASALKAADFLAVGQDEKKAQAAALVEPVAKKALAPKYRRNLMSPQSLAGELNISVRGLNCMLRDLGYLSRHPLLNKPMASTLSATHTYRLTPLGEEYGACLTYASYKDGTPAVNTFRWSNDLLAELGGPV